MPNAQMLFSVICQIKHVMQALDSDICTNAQESLL